MDNGEKAILSVLSEELFVSRRHLSEQCGLSLNATSKAIDSLLDAGYLSEEMKLTDKANKLLSGVNSPNAVILAAGVGMRMAPINLMQPKGMLEVHGEALIERLIRQLHEAGIVDITIVVGFMKERFEYLIDKYGVELVVNRNYMEKNNLHSLSLVVDRVNSTFIVPSDLWCACNPFHRNELRSWYMVSDCADEDSSVRVTKKGNLSRVESGRAGNQMIGIAYLSGEDCVAFRERLRAMAANSDYDDSFWEDALFCSGAPRVMARLVESSEVIEINTYEQLRDLDEDSAQLKSDAIEVAAAVLDASKNEIVDIAILKKGMTNRSFIFSCRGNKYIMRIPGEGTERLIDRSQEAEAFRAISGLGLCDDPLYLNPENGYKITRFLKDVRTCDPEDAKDLEQCMAKLKSFHRMRLSVPHAFDIFERIDFYESLWEGQPSEYRDYAMTKAGVLALRPWVDAQPHDWCLTHIDAVPDNFLFYSDGNGGEALQLTDWEYAGMQDPHVDIAMFCIYAMYDKKRVDQLIDIYFSDEGGCCDSTRAKVYCYIAMCGLLWSNWCEYKRNLGVEFGEYSLAQYRYAKDFRRYAVALVAEIERRG